jgi:hypothetical protein
LSEPLAVLQRQLDVPTNQGSLNGQERLKNRGQQLLLLVADVLLEELLQLKNLREEILVVLRGALKLGQQFPRLPVITQRVLDEVLRLLVTFSEPETGAALRS